MKFGEKLKALRTTKKMTQGEVADAIGVSRRAYIAYEQENTRPRKQETYDKLANVFGCDVNYLRIEDSISGTAGMVAAVSTLGAVLGTVGAITPVGMTAMMTALMGINKGIKKANKSTTVKTESQEELTNDTNHLFMQYEKVQKQFAAITRGILHNAAAEKGFICQQGSLKDISDSRSCPDDCILVFNHKIKNWWLVFSAKYSKLNEHIIMFPEDRASVLISRFVTADSDPERMASIVVDDLELYKVICGYKNRNSYRGNLSVILVDTDTVSIIKEEVIATYYEDDIQQDNCIKLL